MTRTLTAFTLAGCFSLLAGCSGDSSTEFPEDTSPIGDSGVENQAPEQIQGRAVDGYLRDAVVWLDMNGNGRWDQFEKQEFDEETQTRVTVMVDEPLAITGEGGRYTMDVSALQRDELVGPDLDPDDFRLALWAIGGRTFDETLQDTIDQSFFMLAPPGVRTVSPFTTLVELQRTRGVLDTIGGPQQVSASATRVRQILGPRFPAGNLLTDFLQADNAVTPLMAQSLAELIQIQIPQEWDAQARQISLESPTPGQFDILDPDALRVIAEVLLLNSENVVTQVADRVDEVGAEAFRVADLDLNSLALDTSNPYVLSEQRVFIPAEFTEGAERPEGLRESDVRGGDNLSASIAYQYNTGGRIEGMDVNGFTELDMRQLVPILETGGLIGSIDSPTFPGLFINYSSAEAAATPELEEKYRFDWINQTLTLDSARPGIDTSGSGALDDTVDVTWRWTLDADGRVATISQEPAPGVQDLQTLFLEISYQDGEIAQTVLREDGPEGTIQEVRVYGSKDACTVDPNEDKPRREANAIREIGIYDGLPGEMGSTQTGTELLTFGDRNGRSLLFKRTFDFDFADSDTSGPMTIAWFNDYTDEAGDASLLSEAQPFLFDERSLNESEGDPCSAIVTNDRNFLVVTDYQYQRLAEFIRENLF